MTSKATLGTAVLTACLLSQPVFAYQLSPPQIKSILTGRLQFVNSGQPPFSCRVTIVLRTREGSQSHYPEIAKVGVHGLGGDCGNLSFAQDPPWQVQVTGPMGGVIFGGSWVDGGSSCARQNNGFSIDKMGRWTIQPGCLSGTLTSDPPVTVAP